MFAAIVVLAVMGVSGVGALLGSDVAAVVLIVASVLWVPANTPVEGHVWVVLSRDHGITDADLLSVAGVLLAVATLLLRHG